MNYPIIIIGGGKGTRMSKYMPGIPKLLLPLGEDETVLSRLISQSGADSVYLALGADSDKVSKALGEVSASCQISIEKEPLGTFGGLKLLCQRYFNALPSHVIIFLGDLVCSEFQEYQMGVIPQLLGTKQNWFFYTKNNHPYDSDRIEVEDDGMISAVYPKTLRASPHFVNKTLSGLYLLNVEEILQSDIENGDIVMDFLPELVAKETAFATNLLCNLSDIGTPDRFAGLIHSGKFSVARKYLLMDLDGTLIEDRGSSHSAYHQLPVLRKPAVELLGRCNKNGIKVILITNQGDIAKAFLSVDVFKSEIKSIERQLWEEGVWFDDIFWCPHHPDKGFQGEIKELKVACNCRKPNIGMWLAAKKKWSIRRNKAIFVGDTHSDEEFSRNVGLRYFDINAVSEDIGELYNFVGGSK